MGRKALHPADQARKAARKKELKKNKKARQQVRESTLSNHDPKKLMKEFYDLLHQEKCTRDGAECKTLEERRQKIKELLGRVLEHLESNDTEGFSEYTKWEKEFYAKREKRKVFYFTGKLPNPELGHPPPPPPRLKDRRSVFNLLRPYIEIERENTRSETSQDSKSGSEFGDSAEINSDPQSDTDDLHQTDSHASKNGINHNQADAGPATQITENSQAESTFHDQIEGGEDKDDADKQDDKVQNQSQQNLGPATNTASNEVVAGQQHESRTETQTNEKSPENSNADVGSDDEDDIDLDDIPLPEDKGSANPPHQASQPPILRTAPSYPGEIQPHQYPFNRPPLPPFMHGVIPHIRPGTRFATPQPPPGALVSHHTNLPLRPGNPQGRAPPLQVANQPPSMRAVTMPPRPPAPAPTPTPTIMPPSTTQQMKPASRAQVAEDEDSMEEDVKRRLEQLKQQQNEKKVVSQPNESSTLTEIKDSTEVAEHSSDPVQKKIDAASISAAPQVRDRNAELLRMVPSSLRIRRSNPTARTSTNRPHSAMRPVGSLIRKDQRSDAPSESTKSLSTSSTRLETQKRLQEQMLGTKKPSSSQDDAYKKFMEELSGLI